MTFHSRTGTTLQTDPLQNKDSLVSYRKLMCGLADLQGLFLETNVDTFLIKNVFLVNLVKHRHMDNSNP